MKNPARSVLLDEEQNHGMRPVFSTFLTNTLATVRTAIKQAFVFFNSSKPCFRWLPTGANRMFQTKQEVFQKLADVIFNFYQ